MPDSAPDFAVIHAAQLVTVGGGTGGPRRGGDLRRLDVIADGALVASQGRIAAVGTTAEITACHDLAAARMIDAGGKVVMPGLVDNHTHPLFAGLRYDEYAERLGGGGMANVSRRGGGIWSTVVKTREAGDVELLAILRKHFADILRSGTTTVEVKSGYGQTVDQELRQLRLIAEASKQSPLRVVPTFLGAHIVPLEHRDAASYAAEIIDQMLPAVRAQGVARYCDVACDASFTSEIASRILRRAADLGMPGRVHADGLRSSRGWQTAVDNRAVSADHLTYTPDAEIDAAGGVDTVASLIPTAEMYYFTDRRANARRFIDAGVPLVIASDFCSSIHSPSLYQILSLAAAWYRLTPEEVVSATTINPAFGLGMVDQVGSLEVGKWADLIVVDVPHYRMIIYEFGMPRVETVVIGGTIVSSRTAFPVGPESA
jgi:imidazolonepropionase